MSGQITLAYVSSAKPVSEFSELDVVHLRRSVQTADGQVVPEGTICTVLVTWDNGASYEVEFADQIATTAIVVANDLKGDADQE